MPEIQGKNQLRLWFDVGIGWYTTKTGTWEVFYTDVLKTYEKMKAAGVDVRLHVAEKMGHVYPLIPSPEGRKARKEIADVIRK